MNCCFIFRFGSNRDSKLRYFDNIKTLKNSKPFWNECKPYFSKFTSPTFEIAKTFSKHFAEIIETLNTFEWPPNNTDLLNDPLTAIIIKFQSSKYHEIKE